MIYLLLSLLVIFLISFGLIIWLLVLKRKYRALNKNKFSEKETENKAPLNQAEAPEPDAKNKEEKDINRSFEEEKKQVIKPKEPEKIFYQREKKDQKNTEEEKEEKENRPGLDKKSTIFDQQGQELEKNENLIDEFVNKFSLDFKRKIEQTLNNESQRTINLFQEEMSRVSDEVLASYKGQFENALRQLKENYSTFFEKISQENEKIKNELSHLLRQELLKYKDEGSGIKEFLMNETQKTLDSWLENINEKMAAIYSPLEIRIKDKIEEAEKQIEHHKKEKIKETEQKIYQIIEKVIEDVSGKAIDFSTHEELIRQALEKAKAEKFFVDKE